MTLTTHAATGVLVAQVTNQPLLGFTIALFCHYLTDAIPHGDEFLYWRHIHIEKDLLTLIYGALDLLALTMLTLLILNFGKSNDTVLLIAAIVGGVMPDLLTPLYNKLMHLEANNQLKLNTVWDRVYYNALKGHHDLHMFFHNLIQTPIRFRTGIALQLCFLGFFVYYFILD